MLPIKYINIALEFSGAFLSIVLIVCLILGGRKSDMLNKRFVQALACNIAVLLSDACAWMFKGDLGSLSFYIVRIANFCVFTLGYVLLALYTDYILLYLSSKLPVSKKLRVGVWSACMSAVILVIISQFNNMIYSIDSNNMYQRESLFWVSQVWAIACMIFIVILIMKNRKYLDRRENVTLLFYMAIPVAAMIIQCMAYGFALLYFATSVAAVFIYVGIQMDLAKKEREKELELEKSRTEIMLSQIQPHFLYNSLASICYLCHTDPIQAERLTLNFSRYLRGNIESIGTLKNIPFSKELEHLKCYLEIEKVRYKERLKVVFDIETDHFFIPSLTTQPIVENAVHYGIGRSQRGGMVKIWVKEGKKSFIIGIEDDGIGFDTEKIYEDGRVHVGIQNVRQRLKLLCNGELRIESKIGGGTRACIEIPKEWKDSREKNNRKEQSM